LSETGKLFALTSNDEVNTLACLHYAEIFGRRNIFQIAYHEPELATDFEPLPGWRGRILFNKQITYDRIEDLLSRNAEFCVFSITEKSSFNEFLEAGEERLPLILRKPDGTLEVWAEDIPPEPEEGDQIFALCQAGKS